MTSDTVHKLDATSFPQLVRGVPPTARYALKNMLSLRHGSLKVTVPDGRIFLLGGNGPGPRAEVALENWKLPRRAFAGGTIGLAESYVDGDWTSPDVTTFLELFAINVEEGDKIGSASNWLMNAIQRIRHWLNDNTRSGSRKNISAHYDLGNRFYALWLDPSMTYSSALYSTGANDLHAAQIAKYRALADGLGLKSGDHVLEIGCGWGGFAEFAAGQIGCRVTGLTISKEQYDFATERMRKAGLDGRVQIKLQDYRDEAGQFDKIASIEMFEAVGERHWGEYFGKIRSCLVSGGTAGLQIITINEKAYPVYRTHPDFIQRYIFPGGMLPTPSILRELGKAQGLQSLPERVFPQDYARTLAEWRERFWDSWDQIALLGFDPRFKRLWEFYLHYCEAGFRAEYIDVRQVFYKG